MVEWANALLTAVRRELEAEDTKVLGAEIEEAVRLHSSANIDATAAVQQPVEPIAPGKGKLFPRASVGPSLSGHGSMSYLAVFPSHFSYCKLKVVSMDEPEQKGN